MDRLTVPLLVAVALVSGVLGGFAALSLQSAAPPAPSRPMPTAHAANAAAAPVLNGSVPVNGSLYREAYRLLMDSVVSIKVVSQYSGTSQGTGFVYDSSGHIVTNNHVIQGADRVEVRFRNGEWRSAEVVGRDVYSDLAVLKAGNVPSYVEPLPVARSDPVPGSVVMALGNPFGLQETITHGIVSGVNRTMQTAGGFSIPDTVQTDAPINPGNSGGPLVNTAGQVVGVNRAKQGDNIGFAISPAIVRRVVPALIQDGRYTHPFIGVRMADVSPIVAEANDLQQPQGVIVAGVVDDGPSAGILQESRLRARTRSGTVPIGGDIILSIDGQQVEAPRHISSYIATETSPGDTVELTVLRDGERRNVTITVGERPSYRSQRYGG